MITVSIVLYNTPKKMLDRAVKAALCCNLVSRIELVDNSPVKTDFVYNDERVAYSFIGKNLGYSKGHNLILLDKEKRGKYHIVMNPDVWFENNTLEVIFNFMESNEDIGLVMPKILNPDGSLQYHCKLLPSPFDLFARRFIPSRFLNKRTHRFELRDFDYNNIANIPYLNGSFMFLRTTVIDKLGGFDERIFMYGEDLDLSRRFYENSSSVFYPDATVFHEHQRDSYKNLRSFFIHCHGVINYFNKWGWIFDPKRNEINKEVLSSIPREKAE